MGKYSIDWKKTFSFIIFFIGFGSLLLYISYPAYIIFPVLLILPYFLSFGIGSIFYVVASNVFQHCKFCVAGSSLAIVLIISILSRQAFIYTCDLVPDIVICFGRDYTMLFDFSLYIGLLAIGVWEFAIFLHKILPKA